MKTNSIITLLFSLALALASQASILNNTVVDYGQLNGSNILHKAQGTASLVKMNQQNYISVDNAFKVTAGPDLYLMLRNSKDNKVGMFPVTSLTQYSGAQIYKVNLSDSELQKYDQIIIYC